MSGKWWPFCLSLNVLIWCCLEQWSKLAQYLLRNKVGKLFTTMMTVRTLYFMWNVQWLDSASLVYRFVLVPILELVIQILVNFCKFTWSNLDKILHMTLQHSKHCCNDMKNLSCNSFLSQVEWKTFKNLSWDKFQTFFIDTGPSIFSPLLVWYYTNNWIIAC